MPKVYVIQDNGKLNLSDAKRFGELVPLIERDAFPDDADERMGAIYNIMISKLAHFDADNDYILLTGAPEAIAMAFFILGYRETGIQALKWDRENRGYYIVPIVEY